MIAVDLAVFILACIVMLASGSVIVRTLEIVTAFLRMTEFVVGFILIGVSTSLPELFVGINSAIVKNPALSLGNVIGANILDLTLIMGILVVFARGLKYEHKSVSHDSWIMIACAALPLVLMEIGNEISRLDGAILLAAFGAYMYRILRKKKPFRKELVEKASRLKIVLATLIFFAAMVMLMVSASFVVAYGTKLAVDLLLPPLFIGIIFVSLGTTLPELITGLIAVRQHHPEFAVGDIVGSVITNSLLVVGVAAVICPITANIVLFLTSAAFMILCTFLMATFIESGKKLIWQEGIAMILLYVFFMIVEFSLKGYF